MTQGSGRLAGKSAVITGAAFGIGRASAVLFAREGARLTVTDIQGEPLLTFADQLRDTGAGGRGDHRRRLGRGRCAPDDRGGN